MVTITLKSTNLGFWQRTNFYPRGAYVRLHIHYVHVIAKHVVTFITVNARLMLFT